MENRYIIIIAALAAFAVSGNTAIAQPGDGVDDSRGKSWGQHHGSGGGMRSPEEMIGRMAKHLDLDDAQSQSVGNIMEAARPEFASLRERAHEHRQAIRSLDPNDADYGSKLQNLSAQSGELAAELTLLTGRVRGDVNAVLTPEQRQELATITERRGERRGQRRRHTGGNQTR